MPDSKPNPILNAEADASPEDEIRIGVYTCQCGGNISDTTPCEHVAELLEDSPNVVVSRTNMAMCSDIGQKLIESDIREKGVNRVVVGACAPALHEMTFRNAVARAGLNPYLFYHVGLREQNSWVHYNSPQEAFEKALRLMKGGISKARALRSLERIRLPVVQHTLVIGGGIAGLQSALQTAKRGIQVTLLEKSPFLGGRMAQLENTFPTAQPAREALHPLIDEVLDHPLITVHTCSEMVDFHGNVGDYHATVQKKPRGVTGAIDLEKAASVCPVSVPDEFNYGLTERKAIYMRYPDSRPNTPAIDWDNCTKCGACAENPGISLDNAVETLELHVGAVVLATGFDPYEPGQGEYGYGDIPEVITLPQLIRLLDLQETGPSLTYNGKEVRSLALVHCVGSRQLDGVNEPQPDGNVNDYCSRVCCTATLHIANELKERFPDLNIYDVFEDIRTYGRGHEEYYIQASEDGVLFLRFLGEEPPSVEKNSAAEGSPALVQVRDTLTWNTELEIPVDLVVLAVGMMPRQIESLQHLLKAPAGADRFMAEVHPKLQPVETAVNGIVLAGTAQGPMNIQESSAAAAAAAAKISILLGKGFVELDPFVAVVDHNKCDGKGDCVEVCCYEGAIRLEEFEINGDKVKRAVVSPASCVGCGNCVSVCPTRAIDVQGWTLEQFYGMLDAIVAELPVLEVAS